MALFHLSKPISYGNIKKKIFFDYHLKTFAFSFAFCLTLLVARQETKILGFINNFKV